MTSDVRQKDRSNHQSTCKRRRLYQFSCFILKKCIPTITHAHLRNSLLPPPISTRTSDRPRLSQEIRRKFSFDLTLKKLIITEDEDETGGEVKDRGQGKKKAGHHEADTYGGTLAASSAWPKRGSLDVTSRRLDLLMTRRWLQGVGVKYQKYQKFCARYIPRYRPKLWCADLKFQLRFYLIKSKLHLRFWQGPCGTKLLQSSAVCGSVAPKFHLRVCTAAPVLQVPTSGGLDDISIALFRLT